MLNFGHYKDYSFRDIIICFCYFCTNYLFLSFNILNVVIPHFPLTFQFLLKCVGCFHFSYIVKLYLLLNEADFIFL